MNNKGSVLIEVVIGAAIIASSFVAIVGVYTKLTRFSFQALPRIQAAMLAEEGIEAVRAMRDAGYAANLGTLTSGTPYYLSWSTASSTFVATTSVVYVDNTFLRTMTLSAARRDGSFNLATSGTVDANTKLVTIDVLWLENNATSTYTLSSYISNVFAN